MFYLQWHVWIHFKLRQHFGPRFKLLGLGVDVVIKDGALGWKLDGFELRHPPLVELHSIVNQLNSAHAET